MVVPWQLCRTIGPLLSRRLPLASGKAQPRGYFGHLNQFSVYFPVPIGVATNVRAYQYNATALHVEWTPVPDTKENIKGVLLGYRVSREH